MSHILQLNPPMPMETPKGKGLAHFLIDYGAEHHLLWTVFIDATGECWTFANPEIRAQSNPSLGRNGSMRVDTSSERSPVRVVSGSPASA